MLLFEMWQPFTIFKLVQANIIQNLATVYNFCTSTQLLFETHILF